MISGRSKFFNGKNFTAAGTPIVTQLLPIVVAVNFLLKKDSHFYWEHGQFFLNRQTFFQREPNNWRRGNRGQQEKVEEGYPS